MASTTSRLGLTSLKNPGSRTNLYAPHQGGVLTFLHPHYGPNTYADVASAIEEDGLLTPTFPQTVSLVHAAFMSDEENVHAAEIKDLMRNRFFWGFTGIHYAPKEGAYIAPRPAIKNGMPFMERDDLVARLEANDPTVSFVPFGFKTGGMSSHELSQNRFIQALAGGEEGADKLARIADKHKCEPHLWSFTAVDEPTTRVAALYSNWYLDGHRLDVCGSGQGGRGGCAFGVRK